MSEWIISCNPSYYDVIGAFNAKKNINWKQNHSANVKVGDTVYIYVARPYQEIKYETIATKVNLPKSTIDDSEFVLNGKNYVNFDRYMELELVEIFDTGFLPYTELKKNGLSTVQWPTKVSEEKGLLKYITERKNPVQPRERQQDSITDIENQLDQDLVDGVDDLITIYLDEDVPYEAEPQPKPEAKLTVKGRSYARDKQTSIKALTRAKFKCEFDHTHPSFIRKRANVEYTEPHHLIPMAKQGEFDYSLDVVANIVSLCSNCHNQIHYGIDYEKMIEKFYLQRKSELTKAGILVDLETLKTFY